MELIKESFQSYNREMELIYQKLTSLKESYSSNEYNLLLEGFWDKIKNIANSAGNFIGKNAGKTVNTIQKGSEYVHDLGKEIYNKGVELGKKAMGIAKDLYAKIVVEINKGIQKIKKFPKDIWINLNILYMRISDELGEMYQRSKEKGSDWIEQSKKTIIAIYKKMAAKLAETFLSFKKWGQANKEKFKQSVIDKQIEIQEAANTAKHSSFEAIRTIGNWISVNLNKLKSGAIDVSKYIGYFTLGLITLPFYISYWSIVKLHDLGKELLAAMQSGISTLKENLGETWDIYIERMKISYSNEREKIQPAILGGASDFEISNIEIGKKYMYRGKEVEAIAPGENGYTQIQPLGSKGKYAVKSSELIEKTNDNYNYLITKFNNFKY